MCVCVRAREATHENNNFTNQNKMPATICNYCVAFEGYYYYDTWPCLFVPSVLTSMKCSLRSAI